MSTGMYWELVTMPRKVELAEVVVVAVVENVPSSIVVAECC